MKKKKEAPDMTRREIELLGKCIVCLKKLESKELRLIITRKGKETKDEKRSICIPCLRFLRARAIEFEQKAAGAEKKKEEKKILLPGDKGFGNPVIQ